MSTPSQYQLALKCLIFKEFLNLSNPPILNTFRSGLQALSNWPRIFFLYQKKYKKKEGKIGKGFQIGV